MTREEAFQDLDYAPSQAFVDGTPVELTVNIKLLLNQIFDQHEAEIASLKEQLKAKDEELVGLKRTEGAYGKIIDENVTIVSELKATIKEQIAALKNYDVENITLKDRLEDLLEEKQRMIASMQGISRTNQTLTNQIDQMREWIENEAINAEGSMAIRGEFRACLCKLDEITKGNG